MQMSPAAKATNGVKRILIVDPNSRFSAMLRSVLGNDYAIEQVATMTEGIERLSGGVDVVLLNWDWPKKDEKKAGELCQDLLKQAASLPAAVPVVGLTSDERRETAMQIIALGAYDIFTQPLNVFELKHVIDRAYGLVTLTRALTEARGAAFGHIPGLVGNSKPIERVYDLIQKVAGVSTSVLITGQSGTGKEVVARAIHRLSPRAEKPFMAFSPSALPESLIEDELFGHEAGAFTGASHLRRGRFEEAKGGTVFLDEIGDLALPMQIKLLRIIQERCFERLGSSVPVPVDIRLICATNKDLTEMVEAGRFRQDLYFRISVFKLALPPLSQRRDDIPLLADFFCRHFARLHNKDVRGLSPGFVSALAGYDWPGNVRELQNVIERSLILADGPEVRVRDLPQELQRLAVPTDMANGSFHEAVRAFKRELILAALRAHSGNKLQAAKELSISRSYLHRLLNQLDIQTKEDEAAETAER
jgi:DNA-binding NtrC family response regulator